MLSCRQNTFRYTAKIFNISKDEDISDYIDHINISFPDIREISSLIAKFNLDENLIDKGNEISIEVLDEVGNTIYSLTGEAEFESIKAGYITDKFEYTIKDSYNKVFNRIIPKTTVFYDLYVSNNNDKHNSLIHIISSKLGFNEVVADDNLTRIPFIIFKENDRWVDELQTLIAGTNSTFYIKNKVLYFRNLDYKYTTGLEFNDKNIIREVNIEHKNHTYNGVKVLYDRYKRLENQVVFNLASKIILQADEKDSSLMKIEYSTSTVANPSITKATGYYFETDDPNSIIEINLEEGEDYTVKIQDIGAEVTFHNKYNKILYINNFEITGIPLVMYADNESIIKDSNVIQQSQENFIIIPKNKYIQTDEQSERIAEFEYHRNITGNRVYNFYTEFIRNLEIGEIYRLYIRGIDTAVRVLSYDIDLEPSQFTMFITAQEVRTDVITKKSNTDSLNPTTDFINLAPITKKIEVAEEEIKEVTQKVHSKLHTGEEEPTENVEEHDVWLKKSTNEFKIYLNKKWVPVAEEDLLPSIKHFNSLENARLEIGKVNDRAGLFLLNDDEKFGSINGELAEVTLDKQGSIRLKNANNLLEWNVKDPTEPNKIKSKLYMGVTDVTKIPEDVYFKIGDESNGFSLEFKEGFSGVAKIDGEELTTKLKEDKAALENKINDTNKVISVKIDKQKTDISRDIISVKKEAIDSSTAYTDSQTKELKLSIEKVDKDIANQLNASRSEILKESKEYADNLRKLATKKITFTVGGNADTYYPVLFRSDDTSTISNFTVYRRYHETAPDSWHTNTHRGSLYLVINTRFGSTWDGDPTEMNVVRFGETYCNIAGKLYRFVNPGFFIWLRGGGAVYHAYTDNVSTNKSLSAEIFLNGYDYSKEGYAEHYPNLKLISGNYKEVGEAETIYSAMNYKRNQIDAKFKNADGKLTNLQQKYENTVKDVQSYKTETTANIGTVERALQEGNFVVTGNTVFDGNASFISRGNDERITINGGSIDFYRTVGGREQRLTRIKNIRYGTIQTDSKGKGIVDFEGFKQPMLVFPSVKSANFGKNMASIFCYTEHISGTKYRFYVGGTNEDVREATPIKVMGTSWSKNDVTQTTLLSWGGSVNTVVEVESNGREADRVDKIYERPRVKVSILRNNETIITDYYNMEIGKITSNNYHLFKIPISLDISKTVNMFKKFNSRTSLTYTLKLEIVQPKLTLYHVTFLNREPYKTYRGTPFVLSLSHFKNLSITASAETSSISSATGYGEVSYIGMEVD